MKNFSLNSRTRRSSGQVSLILILVVAIALIFYAVAMNLGKVSQVKTVTITASNQAASLLASQMASYGQQKIEIILGGSPRKCGWTGVFGAILTIVIIVIAIFSAGTGATLMSTLVSGAAAAPGLVFALAVGLANLGLQVTVVQPGITEMWNALRQDKLTMSEIFLDNGLATGLQNAVTDHKLVPDLYDFDQDGLFGLNPNGTPKDEVSRFAVYYSDRLRKIKPADTKEKIAEFVAALKDFIYKTEDEVTEDGTEERDWGIYDPLSSCYVRSEANPCCVPLYVLDREGEYEREGLLFLPYRPEYCGDNGRDDGFWESFCLENSSYSDGALSYPWVYDPFWEEASNNDVADITSLSFREQLGVDDENPFYYKERTRLNEDQVLHLPGEEGFRIEDTTGFYAEDARSGIFPFFYKIRDWGVDLQERDPTAEGQSVHCYWSDSTYDPDCTGEESLPDELSANQLRLAEDPANLLYNVNPFVDDVMDNVPGNPPLAPDKITVPEGILARADASGNWSCAQYALDEGQPPTEGFWRAGADRFCGRESDTPENTLYPYPNNCPKHTRDGSGSNNQLCEDMGSGGGSEASLMRECQCEEVNQEVRNTLWHDDVLDGWVYGLRDFIKEAENLMIRADLSSETREALYTSFRDWYPDAAEWIEKGVDGGGVFGVDCCGDNSSCWVGNERREDIDGDGTPEVVGCYQEKGQLWVWRDQMQEVIDRLIAWKETSYVGGSCVVDGDANADVWCVPPIDECQPGSDSTEAITFDVNRNGIRGDIEDVISCLRWNIEDERSYEDGTVARGNAEKFEACRRECNEDKCSELPRSLLPGFDVSGFTDPDPLDQAAIDQMMACLNSCGDLNCQNMLFYQLSTGDPYFPSDLAPVPQLPSVPEGGT